MFTTTETPQSQKRVIQIFPNHDEARLTIATKLKDEAEQARQLENRLNGLLKLAQILETETSHQEKIKAAATAARAARSAASAAFTETFNQFLP